MLSPPKLIAAAALGGALFVGVAIAASPPKGVALLLALGYVPLALINLPLALAAWIPLVFVMRLGLFSVAPLAALMLLGGAWLGTLARQDGTALATVRLHRRVLTLTAGFLIWITLSASWASVPGNTLQDAWQWVAGGLTLALVATVATTPHRVRLVAGAFVIGAVASVLVSLVGVDPPGSASALQTASEADRGRLSGGSADPNFLAAGIVPAVILLSGLLHRRLPLRNLALAAAMGVLTVGLVATESRGGLISTAVAIVGALVFFRGRRPYVVVLVALLASVAAAWFSVYPSALERLTTFDDGGTGRTELWEVARRMSADHPVLGVGLNNFIVEAGDYVRQPGSLEFVNLIAERPHVAHNTYLQLLAETGVIGLAVFLAIFAASLRAAWLAAAGFARRGDHQMAALSRAALVAVLAGGVSSFFISNGSDWRLWVLLGLGPALLGAVRAPAPGRTTAS